MGSLLDGGGSTAFWRPLAHQIYYAALGRVIVSHPLAVAMLHAALLSAAGLLLYRALRPAWSGPAAAAAASLPMLAESTRTLVAWPTQFVDAGLWLFSALALHEASRRRLGTTLAALLAALLCKELAVVTALGIVLWPERRPRGMRVRWALGAGGVVAAWGAAYLAVRHAAHLALPHGLESQAALAATPPGARLDWAFTSCLRAALSLPRVVTPRDPWAIGAGVALVLAPIAAAVAGRRARERLAAARGWIGWGLGWWLAGSTAVATIFPLWQPNRAHFPGVGLGMALVAALDAAHPALPGALIALRLALLGLAPGPVRTIADEPPATGAFMDFERLTRLERFMRAARTALRERYPELPHGAIVVEDGLPHGLIYALGGDEALRVWYRDPTLHWMRYADFKVSPDVHATTVVQFQPGEAQPIVLLPPAAPLAQDAAWRALNAGHAADAVALLDRADSLAADPALRSFHAVSAALRGFALTRLGRAGEAEGEARRALALDPLAPNARFVLASALALERRDGEARAVLDTLLAERPGDRAALALASRLRAPPR